MLNSRTPTLEQTIDLMLSEVRKSCSEIWLMHCLSDSRFHRDSFDAGIDAAVEACAFAFKGMTVHLDDMQARHDAVRSKGEESCESCHREMSRVLGPAAG